MGIICSSCCSLSQAEDFFKNPCWELSPRSMVPVNALSWVSVISCMVSCTLLTVPKRFPSGKIPSRIRSWLSGASKARKGLI